ncbi:MAG: hypothetical protein KH260_03020 [Lachnospiraceae bacterium oral taxon 082]|jgi:hypothetical protein|nr:hypothetical protein HMPREF9099_01045 [Lachnospiraceae bacterium oral taxon 082 str. F0431]MBS6728268.1 hypothetical protein [Lachnospiraceae bacterium oral taxon 082]
MNYSYFSESEFKILLCACGAGQIYIPTSGKAITQSKYNEGIFSLLKRELIFRDGDEFIVSDNIKEEFYPIKDAVEVLEVEDLPNYQNIVLYITKERTTVAQISKTLDFYIRLASIKTADIMEYFKDSTEYKDFVCVKRYGKVCKNIRIDLNSHCNIVDCIRSSDNMEEKW